MVPKILQRSHCTFNRLTRSAIAYTARQSKINCPARKKETTPTISARQYSSPLPPPPPSPYCLFHMSFVANDKVHLQILEFSTKHSTGNLSLHCYSSHVRISPGTIRSRRRNSRNLRSPVWRTRYSPANYGLYIDPFHIDRAPRRLTANFNSVEKQ